MAIVEIRMCDEDRAKLGGPEWIPLDIDKVFATPSDRLERWEEEIGGPGNPYSLARGLLECTAGKYAAAIHKRAVLWIARKQAPGRPHVDADGNPEPFTALASVQAHQIEFRSPKVADADPPEESTDSPSPA